MQCIVMHRMLRMQLQSSVQFSMLYTVFIELNSQPAALPNLAPFVVAKLQFTNLLPGCVTLHCCHPRRQSCLLLRCCWA